MYFDTCHTPDALKETYRIWAKKLHPDKEGGNAADFRCMQDEYDQIKNNIDGNRSRNTLPDLFDANDIYEYYYRSVKFVGVYYNHYYKFIQDHGADILIDLLHVNLIFRKNRMI